MRYLIIGAALAATCGAAQAQDTVWGAFESPDGSAGVGVQAADGSQLLVKCDKPGKGSVYAVVVPTLKLVPPQADRFTMRPVELRFDSNPPADDRWRFYEQAATAVNQTTERPLARLLIGIADASKLRVRLNPERSRFVEANFDVTGAREAIALAYESCQDENPYG